MQRDYQSLKREHALDAAVDKGRAQEQINTNTLDSSEAGTNTEVTDPFDRRYDSDDGKCLFGWRGTD